MSRRVMSVVGYLRTQCRMPLRGIGQVLKGLHGLKLSEGEVSDLLAEVAERGQGTYEAYREEMRSSPVVHADETGLRMRKLVQELFVFVPYPEVPSGNNAAELAIRPLATARKVFGGTRSPRGSQTMAILQTLYGTWSLRGLDPLEACMAMLASS